MPRAVEQLLDPQLIVHLMASKYYMLASVVVLYFDYFLTFDLEIENLWRTRYTAPTILFILNRYYPMLLYVVVLVATHDPSWSGEVCDNFKRFPLIAALVSEAIIGIIVILRLYALYAQCIRILCVLAPLYILQLILGWWASNAVIQATGLPPSSGCVISVSPELTDRFAWLWGSSALFDAIVFGLTMYRTLSLRHSGLRVPITTLFLRDGIVYFAVMFSAKLLNFILFWTAITPGLVTLNWTFNNTITVIMINRLVLNLRQEGARRTVLDGSPADSTYTDRFMGTFVAELGCSISKREECEEMAAWEEVQGEPDNEKVERGRVGGKGRPINDVLSIERGDLLMRLEEGWRE